MKYDLTLLDHQRGTAISRTTPRSVVFMVPLWLSERRNLRGSRDVFKEALKRNAIAAGVECAIQEIRDRIKAVDEKGISSIPYDRIKREITSRFGSR